MGVLFKRSLDFFASCPGIPHLAEKSGVSADFQPFHARLLRQTGPEFSFRRAKGRGGKTLGLDDVPFFHLGQEFGRHRLGGALPTDVDGWARGPRVQAVRRRAGLKGYRLTVPHVRQVTLRRPRVIRWRAVVPSMRRVAHERQIWRRSPEGMETWYRMAMRRANWT